MKVANWPGRPRRRPWRALAVLLSLLVTLAAACGPNNHGQSNVAVLGDSYSSGEGSGDWISPTGDGAYYKGAPGTCHRSNDAYAETVLNADLFVACSGATSGDMQKTYRGEPSQVSRLQAAGSQITTVVLSAGGDDAGFARVLGDCTTFIGTGHPENLCGQDITDSEQGLNGFTGFDQIGNNLVALYGRILAAAPQAQLYVVGYPQIFPPNGFDGCNGITPANQVALNKATVVLDNTVRRAVETANSPRITFVDVTNVLANHWICGNPWPNAGWINDLQIRLTTTDTLWATLAGGLAGYEATHNCPVNDVAQWQLTIIGICSQSYHPSQDGTKAIGDKILQCINNATTCDSSPLTTPAGPTTVDCSAPGMAEGATTLGFQATGLSCADGEHVLRSFFSAIGTTKVKWSPGARWVEADGFGCQSPGTPVPGSSPQLQPGSPVTCTKGAEEISFTLPG